MANYGLGPATADMPAGWQAQFLGPGAKAMMGMASQGISAPGKDPQTQAVLAKAFGGGFIPGTGTGGSTWNLGIDPFDVSKQLGQNPLQQLMRNQQFTQNLSSQWQPIATTLSGRDLFDVATQQAAIRGQQQQAMLSNATTAYNAAVGAQAAAQASELQGLGQLASSGIKAAFSPSLSSGGYYQPSLFGGLFGGGGFGDAFSGISYGAGSDVSSALGPSMESAFAGDTGGGLFSGS
jgi:hypothetical protein